MCGKRSAESRVKGLEVVVGWDVWEVMRVSEQLLQMGDHPRWFAVVGSRKITYLLLVW